jgi:hypothetical protein
VAWTAETEAAAKVICEQLWSCGFESTWMSHQIPAGSRFRDEIRRSICDADLVIAVLPREPSRWLTAEAGLAYFEEKLLPIAIDEDIIVEPFSELQTHKVTGHDVNAGSGRSIDQLIQIVEEKLGFAPDSLLVGMVVRCVNTLFFYGIPLLGLHCVGAVGLHSRFTRRSQGWHRARSLSSLEGRAYDIRSDRLWRCVFHSARVR